MSAKARPQRAPVRRRSWRDPLALWVGVIGPLAALAGALIGTLALGGVDAVGAGAALAFFASAPLWLGWLALRRRLAQQVLLHGAEGTLLIDLRNPNWCYITLTIGGEVRQRREQTFEYLYKYLPPVLALPWADLDRPAYDIEGLSYKWVWNVCAPHSSAYVAATGENLIILFHDAMSKPVGTLTLSPHQRRAALRQLRRTAYANGLRHV